MAKSKDSAQFVLTSEARDAESPEERAEWAAFVHRGLAEGSLANDLHKKLLNGAKNQVSKQKIEPALDLKRVGEFLAWLSYSDKASLAATATSGLGGLGIERHSPKLGRPKGRKAERLYIQYVEQVAREIEQKGIFSVKKNLRERYRGDWSDRFRKHLEHGDWSIEEISWLLVSKKPLSFAMRKAANHFHVSSAAIERAWQRAGKSAKKKS